MKNRIVEWFWWSMLILKWRTIHFWQKNKLNIGTYFSVYMSLAKYSNVTNPRKLRKLAKKTFWWMCFSHFYLPMEGLKISPLDIGKKFPFSNEKIKTIIGDIQSPTAVLSLYHVALYPLLMTMLIAEASKKTGKPIYILAYPEVGNMIQRWAGVGTLIEKRRLLEILRGELSIYIYTRQILGNS